MEEIESLFYPLLNDLDLSLNVDYIFDYADCNSNVSSIDINRVSNKSKEQVLYSCNKCDSSFIDKSKYKIHLRSHTGECPYLCEICGISYRTNTSRLRHYRQQHKDKMPYECHCGEGFDSRIKLLVHKSNTHVIGVKYKCKICGMGFVTTGDYNRHIRFTHSTREYKCNLCDSTYRNLGDLNKHKRNKH